MSTTMSMMNTTMKNNLRSCLITRKKLEKSLLFRIVRTPQGVVGIDIDYTLPGRGAYLSKDKDVILKAKKSNAISRALRCNTPLEIYDELINML